MAFLLGHQLRVERREELVVDKRAVNLLEFAIVIVEAHLHPGLPHLLGSVTTPTLVVWGKDDRIVPLECGERYVKALRNATLEIIDGAGHFEEIEKPDALARLVGGSR